MAKSTTGSSADASAKSVGSVALVKFNFHGDELDVIPMGARAHISIKRVCEVLGVDFSRQLRKLKDDPAICVDMMSIQVPGDDQRREVACIEVRSLPLWLATIHPSKVKPEVREKLIAYRREAAEVLADHFLGKRGALPEGALSKEDAQRMVLRYASRMTYMETEKKRILGELAAVKADLDKALDTSSALIAARDAERLKRDMMEVAKLMVRLGKSKKPNVRSALLTVRNRVMSRWLGAGRTIDGMPREHVAECLAALRVMKRDYEDELKRAAVAAQTNMFPIFDAYSSHRPN